MNDQLLDQEQVRQLLMLRYNLKSYSLRSAVRWLIAKKVENVGPSRKRPRYSKNVIVHQLSNWIPKDKSADSVLTVKAALAARGKR